MSASLEGVPVHFTQDVLSEPEELSRFQDVVDFSKRLICRTVLALSLATGAITGEAVIGPQVARAESGSYPDADKPCVAMGDAQYGETDGSGYWCDGYQWGILSSGAQNSSRGYGYRNCTDWVAWRIPELVQKSVPRGWGDAKNWDDKATTAKYTVDDTPEPGDIAVWESGTYGHVEVVESVNSDGTANTSGYNKHRDGKYDTQTHVTADHYIDLNGTGKGVNGDVAGGNGVPTPPPKDGTQMILNHAEEIWAKTGVVGGGWTSEAAGGSAIDVASGGGVQMILDHAGQVWARQGIGGDWTQETGPNSAVEIEVGSDGLQMIRDNASQVWAKKGVGWSGFIQEAGPGSAKDIETNGGVQVILNYTNQLWVKNTIGWSGWEPESGENGAVEVEVSNDGTQMVRNARGEVWARTNTANSGWVQEVGAGSAAEIAINNGIQLIRDNADQIWIKTGNVGWGGWQAETAAGSAVEIVVEDDGTQVLRDHVDTIYARSTAAYSNWVQETGAGAAAAIGD